MQPLKANHIHVTLGLKETEDQTSQRDTPRLHDEALAFETANRWPWAYALGYASGLDDSRNGRKSDHLTSENDDYALGYHKGFAVRAASNLN